MSIIPNNWELLAPVLEKKHEGGSNQNFLDKGNAKK